MCVYEDDRDQLLCVAPLPALWLFSAVVHKICSEIPVLAMSSKYTDACLNREHATAVSASCLLWCIWYSAVRGASICAAALSCSTNACTRHV